jgi:hypothetical protein
MGKVIKLYCARHAWNIDGSSGDQRLDQYGNKISWIKYWENKTGIKRSICSYSDCNQDAICGGHIWVKKVGVVIAPICNECNHISNLDRQQNINGYNSKLRKNSLVVKVKMTEDMKNSDRRLSVYIRTCDDCGDDISRQPENHTKCKNCFSGSIYRRTCDDCGDDISRQPENHTKCKNCFYSY